LEKEKSALPDQAGVQKLLSILGFVRILMQAILPDESLCWILYNGTFSSKMSGCCTFHTDNKCWCDLFSIFPQARYTCMTYAGSWCQQAMLHRFSKTVYMFCKTFKDNNTVYKKTKTKKNQDHW